MTQKEEVIKILKERGMIESEHNFNAFMFVVGEDDNHYEVVIDGTFTIKKKMTKKNKEISVVYNKQRWDVVRLIKGFDSKKSAKNLRKSLANKEKCYDEIYCTEEIEVEEEYYPLTTCVICKCAKKTEKCFISTETKEDFCIECIRKHSVFYLLNKISYSDFMKKEMEKYDDKKNKIMKCSHPLCDAEIKKGDKYIIESSSMGRDATWHLQCYDLLVYSIQEDPTRPHEVEKIRKEYKENREKMIKVR